MADSSISQSYAGAAGDGGSGRTASPAMLDFANTIIVLAIAALMIAVPVAAHGVHAALGITLALGLSIACAWRLPHVAVIAIIFAFLFQNLIVSVMADLVRSKEDFDVIRAYNFLILAVTWVVTAIRFLATWRSYDPAIMPYVKLSTALMVVIGVYFVIGFAFNGIPAIIYLRNIVTPLLLFQICLTLFATHSVRLGPSLTGLAVLTMACGYLEFANREDWLTWTNGYAYWDLAAGANWATLAYDKLALETGHVTTSLIDSFQIDFLNSPLFADFGGRMTRLFGPNMHAISFAYALTFFLVFALFRGRWLQALLLFVLLFLCNAKGPLLIVFLVAAAWMAFRLCGAGFAFLSLSMALVIYAVAGIVIGLSVGDFHVLGLMSAFHEFPKNPLGYGIGSGGNLSPLFSTINWYDAQAEGRTPFPVESSVGVLLYQMGISALAIVGGYIWIAWRVLCVARKTGNNLQAAAAFGLMGVVANGLFQEEAFFAPLALAMFMGLAGMVLGAAVRSGVEQRASR